MAEMLEAQTGANINTQNNSALQNPRDVLLAADAARMSGHPTRPWHTSMISSPIFPRTPRLAPCALPVPRFCCPSTDVMKPPKPSRQK